MSLDVALTFLVRVARLLSGLAASIVTARALGPAGRGEYFLIVTVSALIVQVGSLGLASSNTYLVARDAGLLRRLTDNSVIVSLVTGVGLASIAVLFLRFGPAVSVSLSLLLPVVVLAPVSLFYLLGSNLLVGVGQIVRYNTIEAVATVVVTVSIVVAAIGQGTPLAVIVGSTVGWVVATAILVTALIGRRISLPRFDAITFRLGLRFALKAYLVTMLGAAALRLNVFVLQFLSGSTQVGYFAVASQVAESLGLFPVSVALVLFPKLIRNAGQSWSLTVRSMLLVGSVLGLACLAIALVADPLVRLAFGAQFAPSADTLRLLLPGVVALGMLTVVSQFLGAAGIPLALVGAWAGALVLVALLGAILIPGAAASGAALALSLTYVCLFFAVTAIGVRYRGK